VPPHKGFLNPGRKEGEQENVEQKMNKNMQDKVQKVAEIAERLKTAKAMVLVDYKGISVEEINALRGKFREAGVEYVVLKNTLVRRAMDDAGITELDHLLVGPSAFAFGIKDEVGPAKVISEFIEQSKSDKMTIKAGIVSGKVIDAAGVAALSKLPPKEVLIAKMMGSLNAPVTNFVGVLSATLRSLVYAVDAVRKQKEGEEANA
jgi:large subunit ribosomal protein L10